MEAETLLVVLVYCLIGLVVLLGFIIILLYRKFTIQIEQSSEFVKLMLSLYEEEKEKTRTTGLQD